ncbi:hypothetical protein C5167_035499 [Papaver somniferum]|uniref:Uncharacterized protein n=1 Tax=Papaver somniferum TaxID=3469 RepID=A0A4Y7KHG6_PAPSO|nr:uncharacterized protein LOC113293748 [Papaver somniferum]RZC72297.1 hypothetical protein C5167_035499 [Papaver somniferum]
MSPMFKFTFTSSQFSQPELQIYFRANFSRISIFRFICSNRTFAGRWSCEQVPCTFGICLQNPYGVPQGAFGEKQDLKNQGHELKVWAVTGFFAFDVSITSGLYLEIGLLCSFYFLGSVLICLCPAAKTNSLADIGVDFYQLQGEEKAVPQTAVTSTINTGIGMGDEGGMQGMGMRGYGGMTQQPGGEQQVCGWERTIWVACRWRTNATDSARSPPMVCYNPRCDQVVILLKTRTVVMKEWETKTALGDPRPRRGFGNSFQPAIDAPRLLRAKMSTKGCINSNL